MSRWVEIQIHTVPTCHWFPTGADIIRQNCATDKGLFISHVMQIGGEGGSAVLSHCSERMGSQRTKRTTLSFLESVFSFAYLISGKWEPSQLMVLEYLLNNNELFHDRCHGGAVISSSPIETIKNKKNSNQCCEADFQINVKVKKIEEIPKPNQLLANQKLRLFQNKLVWILNEKHIKLSNLKLYT